MRSGKRRGKTKNCNKLSRLKLLEEVCSALSSSGRRAAVGPLRSRRQRGPLGAPGCAAPWAAQCIPGPGGERCGRPAWTAGCARQARSAGSWGRSLARLPPRSSHWPFVLQLCPSPSGSRAAPAPAPSRCPGKVCVPGSAPRWRRLTLPSGWGKLSRSGDLWQLRP